MSKKEKTKKVKKVKKSSVQVKVSDPKETTPTFTWLNPATNLLEIRNFITGDLLAVQRSMDENILYAKEKKSQIVKVNGKDILVEAGISPDKLNVHMTGIQAKWAYSTLIGESICQEILRGKPITRLENEQFPPYAIICKWRKENSSFNKMVNDAFASRGEFHRDKILEIIEEEPMTNDEGEILDTNERKFQVDTHKWLASTDNASRFGNKTKVEGEVEVKHTVFQIDTGIRRPGDPGYRRDETRTVQELESKKQNEGAQDAGTKREEVTRDVKEKSTLRGGDDFTLKSEESEASDGGFDLCGSDSNR